MNRKMTEPEIDQYFDSNQFTDGVESPLYASYAHDRRRIAIYAVVFPATDTLFYKLYHGHDVLAMYGNFADALAAFKEML